jgi:hypothetical protein
MWRGIVTQTTIAYLEGRHVTLENKIANALQQSSTDDLAVADLKHRKLMIADEILHHRRLVKRFGILAGSPL